MTKTRSEDGSIVPKSMQLWSAWCPYVLTFGLLVLFIVALGIHSYARELPGLELVLFSLATLHAWFFYRGEFCWPSFDQSAHIAHLHLHCDVLWRHGSRRAFGLRRFRHSVGDLVCYHVEESNWARCHETRETSQIGPCGGVCHAGRQGNERNKTVNSSPPGRVWSCLS